MKKEYIAKFEVEIEIKSNNKRNANSLLKDIRFDKEVFGSEGRVETVKSDLISFDEVN